MDHPITSKHLADVLAHYRMTYLLSISDKGTPHASPVSAVLEGGELVVAGFGRRSRGNAAARPAISLLWPPASDDGYTLIVDGQAVAEGEALRVGITRAVLHRSRPAPTPVDPGHCDSDCVELEY